MISNFLIKIEFWKNEIGPIIMKSNIADVIGLRETRVIFCCEILVIFVK